MLRNKRQFFISGSTNKEVIEEVLKYELPPGSLTVKTLYFVSIETPKDEGHRADEIAKMLKDAIPDVKVEFHDQIPVKPKVPSNTKIRYFIDKDYDTRDNSTAVEIYTERQLLTKNFNDPEDFAIIDVMLDKAGLGNDNSDGNIFYWEKSPKQLQQILTKENGFIRSRRPLR